MIFIDFVSNVLCPELLHITSREHFDQRHNKWVERLRKEFGGSEKVVSYGQGQKSINVFLKFYVDWCGMPNSRVAARVRAWLHCPLDNVVMESLERRFRSEYRTRIAPRYEGVRSQQRRSLTKMGRPAYQAWQGWIRDMSPMKPVLVDVLWALERSISNGNPRETLGA
jgi:hypothetical protein